MQYRNLFVLSVSLVLVTGAPSAQTNLTFSMNYSASAVPLAGWPVLADLSGNQGVRFTQQRVAGACSNGGDAYRLTQLSAPNASSFGGQYNWGWRGDTESSAAPTGVPRYYRFRLKFSPNTNFHGLDWSSGGSTGQQNKFLILGFNSGRLIMTTRASRNAGFIFTVGIDGGGNEIESPSYAVGQWLNVQLKVVRGQGYALYVGTANNNESTPTVQRMGINVGAANWNNTWLGAFMNDGMASDGVYSYDICDFQIASTFNAQWNGGGTNPLPLPAPPTAVNLRR
jgi:hypothetical protein